MLRYKIKIILSENNCINLPRSISLKFWFNENASASAFAPSTPILLFSIIITKCKYNWLISFIKNKHWNYVLLIKIIIKLKIKKK